MNTFEGSFYETLPPCRSMKSTFSLYWLCVRIIHPTTKMRIAPWLRLSCRACPESSRHSAVMAPRLGMASPSGVIIDTNATQRINNPRLKGSAKALSIRLLASKA
jgi:hypothetical protein